MGCRIRELGPRARHFHRFGELWLTEQPWSSPTFGLESASRLLQATLSNEPLACCLGASFALITWQLPAAQAVPTLDLDQTETPSPSEPQHFHHFHAFTYLDILVHGSQPARHCTEALHSELWTRNMPVVYPYTVTNSQKGGFFMRTYNRNVRRVWDGDNYHAPKRLKLDTPRRVSQPVANENANHLLVEDNLQRAIRETSVVALSSSPSRKNSTVFSFEHDVHEPVTLTPPSSPPPLLDITPPAIKSRRPTFSALEKKKQKEKEKLKKAKRKRDDDEMGIREHSDPLSEILNSSSRVSVPPFHGFEPVQPLSRTPAPPKVLTQTVLDFGQSNVPISCSQCQMSYQPSVVEDAKLHDMYHNRHKDGIELDKAFTKSAMKWGYEVPGIPGSVVVVDRKISFPARRTVQKVLEVVNRELGSVEIPEAELWGQKTLEGDTDDSKKVDCYKVFLHVLNNKCVAVCLAERISKAYKVKSANVPERTTDPLATTITPPPPPPPPPAAEKDLPNNSKEDSALLTPTSSSAPQPHFPSSADLELESDATSVVVGVSRIWVSKGFRRKGIANNLLDCVTTQFIYGLDIDKEEVAFSQPTDLGASLARAWFGDGRGWRVYREG